MTETETIQMNKPWYKRVLACFCSFLICCLVCFCGFAIPKVHAQSVLDQWEDYTDEFFGEGASFTIEEMAEKTGGVPAFIYLYALSHLPYTIDESCPLESLSSLQGYYYHNGKHVCQSLIKSGVYSDSSLQTLAYSDEFTIIPWVSGSTVNRVIGAINSGNRNAEIYFETQSSMVNHVDGDGTIFPSTYFESGSTGLSCFCYYDLLPPTLSDNSVTGDFFWWGSRFSSSGKYPVAGGFDIPYLNFGNYVSALGLDSTFEISPDNVVDYVVNTYNPVIIETYPDLVQFLFLPQDTPTETTSPSGCGCHVDVYIEPTIIVEPSINIYVNPWELPSDEQDYTLPTTPAHETIPFPTQDSSNTELVTMPTMDLEEFQQTYKNAFDFWFYCAEQLIEKMNLQILLTFVFVVTVVGFIMWKLGG